MDAEVMCPVGQKRRRRSATGVITLQKLVARFRFSGYRFGRHRRTG